MKIEIRILVLIILILSSISYFFIDKNLALFFSKIVIAHNFYEKLFLKITFLGDATFYLVLFLLIFIIAKRYNQTLSKKALYIFSSVAISGIIILIFKFIFARFRPKMLVENDLFGFNWFEFGHSVNSFPSGHSATAFSVFVALTLLKPKYYYIFLPMAVLIAFSRVVLWVHFLSDVLIGSLIGGFTSYYLYKYYFKEGL